jgi:hypothetical protein
MGASGIPLHKGSDISLSKALALTATMIAEPSVPMTIGYESRARSEAEILAAAFGRILGAACCSRLVDDQRIRLLTHAAAREITGAAKDQADFTAAASRLEEGIDVGENAISSDRTSGEIAEAAMGAAEQLLRGIKPGAS